MKANHMNKEIATGRGPRVSRCPYVHVDGPRTTGTMSIRIDRDHEHAHVAHLRFDFGELNLLTPAAIESLATAVDDVPDDVSVVTIRGDGDDGVGGLTGGLHLEQVRDFDAQEAQETIGQLRTALARVRNLCAVTVCGCGAYALGAGLELAMACDFRVTTDDAVLGLPEINVGLVTGIQGGLLIRLVGVQAAKELIFTGEPISGTHAAEIGLVNHAVSAANYEETLRDLVETLAAKPPRITQLQTEVFRAWRSNGVESGIKSSAETIALCFGTDAQQRAMAAFLDEETAESDERQ